MSSFLIILFALLNCTNAQNDKWLTKQNCMNCARGENYFCHSTFGGTITNPWDIQCCHDGATNPFCSAQTNNNTVCSEKFSVNKGSYFSDCPVQTKKTCGLKNNYDDLNLYASGNRTSFQFQQLRYATNKWKITKYSVCSYNVMNPPGGYKGGNIYFQVTKLEDGVKLYIQSDDNKIIPDEQVSLVAKKIYKLDGSKSLKVTAVPTLNSFNTSYDFKYWNDGTKIPNAPIFAKIVAYNEQMRILNSKHQIPVFIYFIMGGVAGLLILFIIGCILYQRRAEKLEKAMDASKIEGMAELPEMDQTKLDVLDPDADSIKFTGKKTSEETSKQVTVGGRRGRR